jgi:hypothetical protein
MPNRSAAAQDLPARLRRWAKAREKRLAQGGHAGVTGTDILVEAADEIDRLREQVNSGRSYRETQEGLPEGTLPRV